MSELKKIIDSTKKEGFKPVYFLMGDEPYFIDYLCDYFLNNVIPEEEKSFNQIIMYGKDTTINDIMSQARQYPFMGERILIVVKEAQDLIKTIDQFSNYFKSVQQSTTIVFCYKYKTLDKRKELYKTISKSQDVVLFESSKIKDYQLEGWLKNYIAEDGLQIEPKASAMLVEFLGNDLSKIINELNKLKIVLNNDKLISAEIVEKNIGISKDYNNFELINAIANKHDAKAFSIAKYFALNTKNNPFVVTISLLYNFFSRLLQYHGLTYKNASANPNDIAKQLGISPYGLKDYQIASKLYPMKRVSQNIAAIREIDLKGKGVDGNLSHDDLLKELLIKILR